MMLLTQEMARKLRKLYSQEQSSDPVVYVKFFLPCMNFVACGGTTTSTGSIPTVGSTPTATPTEAPTLTPIPNVDITTNDVDITTNANGNLVFDPTDISFSRVQVSL